MTKEEALLVLELEPKPSRERIAQARRLHILAWHPDRFHEPESIAHANKKTQQVLLAADVLLGREPASGEESPAETENPKKPNASSGAERDLIAAVEAIPADVWGKLSRWAKEEQELTSWQRSLSYSLGKLRKAPSNKQAIQGRRLVLKALERGFTHKELTADLTRVLKKCHGE